MESRRITVTFSTSADADAKKNKESVNSTTTIIFKNWTDNDFDMAAASRVIIHNLQPLGRAGKVIPKEYEAPRPGFKGIQQISHWDALVKVFGGDKVLAAKVSDQYGGAERAMEQVKIQMLAMQTKAIEATEE